MAKLEFTIEDDDEGKTVEDLQDEFYGWTKLSKKEMLPKYRNRPLLRIVRPQALVFNPPGFGDPESVVHTDVYIACYYHGYYVRIQCGESVFGPHKYELFYQVRKGKREWLGTATARHDFYSKKRIYKKLRRMIHKREYFASELSRKRVIKLYIPEPEARI